MSKLPVSLVKLSDKDVVVKVESVGCRLIKDYETDTTIHFRSCPYATLFKK